MPIEGRGGLNKNGPHRLVYLNIWSPVGEAVWERLGGVQRFQKTTPFPLFLSLLCGCVSQDVRSLLLLQGRSCLPAYLLPAAMFPIIGVLDPNLLELEALNKLFLL